MLAVCRCVNRGRQDLQHLRAAVSLALAVDAVVADHGETAHTTACLVCVLSYSGL